MKHFSNGANAQVYRLEPGDREWPTHRTDLLYRIEHLSSQPHFALGFYSHRIASLLFPHHFPKVLGGRKHGTCSVLISEEANVPQEHAAYSKHSDHVGWGVKTVCQCPVCKTHHAFHQDENLEVRAYAAAVEMREFGIHVPAKDRTDYCVNPDTGHIIFFETFVSIHELRVAIAKNLLADSTERDVVPTLDRLQYLNRISG